VFSHEVRDFQLAKNLIKRVSRASAASFVLGDRVGIGGAGVGISRWPYEHSSGDAADATAAKSSYGTNEMEQERACFSGPAASSWPTSEKCEIRDRRQNQVYGDRGPSPDSDTVNPGSSC